MRLGSRWLARALFSVLRRSATLFGRTVRPRLVLSLVCLGAMLVLVAQAAGSPPSGARGRVAAAGPSQPAAHFPGYVHVTRARRRLIPRPLRRPAAPPRRLRLFGGNLSGAVVDSAGCHQYTQAGGWYNSFAAQLPFWLNFYGKAYRHIYVNTEGYTWFDGSDPNYSVGYPPPFHQEYDGYPNRIIAPFMVFGDEWTAFGTAPITWGTTTYDGHEAFCVLWTGGYNWDACISPPPVDYSKTNTFQMLLVRRNDVGYDDFDIVFNYGSIQWDHPGTDAGDQGTKYQCPDAAGVGWKVGGGGASALLNGSWTFGSFLDSNPSGLIHGSLGSSQLGRYVWNIRNGSEAPHVDPLQTLGTPALGPDQSGAWGVNPTATAGEPVDTASGSYYNSVKDLSLPGTGVPFAFTRSYNSADTLSGPLGPGWTDSLNASLTVQANGDVLARSGNGQQLMFTANGDGTFTPPIGGRSSLTTTANGYELVTHDQLHFAFDGSGRLQSVHDRNGQGLALADNADGTLATVTDSVGRVITFSYSGGLLSQVSLPDGRHVSYGYDGSGRLATVTDVRGGTTHYTYDAGGRLATVVDQDNHTVVQNTYDPATGRVTRQVDARGGVSTFSWDPSTQTSTFVDPRGNSWSDVYVNNVLVDQIDPLGHDTHYQYDAQLNVTAITDPLGNETDMTYDGRGNLLTRAEPLGYKQTWTYDGLNDVTTYLDRVGQKTTYVYDAAGNLSSTTAPDPGGGAPVTTYAHDPATGLLTSVTDPRGKTTVYGYTGGNLTSITTPLGEKTTMAYDGSGRLLARVDPRGNVTGADPNQYKTTFGYDDADDLVSTTDPLGHTTSSTYDAAGNRTSVTDANGHKTSYGYDQANHLTTVTAPDSSVTTYGYDGAGNLVSRTDANGHAATFGYDAANEQISKTSAGGRKWTYSYDANGNRTSMVDANNGTTSYTFDALDRLTNVNYSDGTPAVTLSYDGEDRLRSMQDGAGGQSYSYDALGRLASTGRGTFSFQYAYDPAGDVIQRLFSYSGGSTQATYTYDDDGRMQTAAGAAGATSYRYDPAGELVTTTLPAGNGYVETRTYDQAGRLVDVATKKGTSVLADVAVTRDPVGNPTTVVRTGALASTEKYTYDTLDRITEVCYQASPCTSGTSPFIRWTYDKAGNRLTQARPAGTTSYTYDTDDRMLTAGSTSYSYDGNGNEIQAGSTAYTYNMANELTSASTSKRSKTTYTYSGGGLRLSAATGSQASSITNYAWDILGAVPQLAGETNGSNALVRSYLYGAERIAMTTPAGTFYYHYDALGSTINVTSATGATQWTDAYEPFGAIRTETKVANKAPDNPMKFAGEYLDPTGLYHLRERQYDPALGRFLAADPLPPLATAPLISSYIYVRDQPTVATDPTGLCGLLCGAVGAVVGEATYVGESLYNGTPITWQGAVGAAAGGAVAGVIGGPIGDAAEGMLGDYVGSTGARVVGQAFGGAVGGVASATTAAVVSSFGGCGGGLPSAGELARAAAGGAVGELARKNVFPQHGFHVRTLRGAGRLSRPNTRRMWGGELVGGVAEAAVAGGGAEGGCGGMGVNGK